MGSNYKKWIRSNIDKNNTYGKCKEYCVVMLKAFPELTKVRGHYICPIWGSRPHWWLKDESGNIIDPTRFQFPVGVDDIT